MRHVLPEGGQQLDDERDRGRHERGVEQRVDGEDAVAQDAAPAAAEMSLVQRGRANPREDDHVAEKRHAVDREEDGERPRMTDRGDQPRDDATERDADVHGEALQRVRGHSPGRGRQAGEESRLRRPERAAADAPQRVDRERLPRRPDQRHQRERDRHHDECAEQHALRADPIGERPAKEAARECRRRLDRRRAAGEPERDPAHVVEVDEEEREDDAVPERVDERPGLKDVHVARQARVEATEVAAHRRGG